MGYGQHLKRRGLPVSLSFAPGTRHRRRIMRHTASALHEATSRWGVPPAPSTPAGVEFGSQPRSDRLGRHPVISLVTARPVMSDIL